MTVYPMVGYFENLKCRVLEEPILFLVAWKWNL